MKMWKKWSLLSVVMILCVALALVGCGNSNDSNGAEATNPEAEEINQEADNTDAVEEQVDSSDNLAGFPVTFTDGVGRELTIEAEPESIVSVYPSNTEITYALGQGDKVVGVSAYCNYPAAALEVQQVGDMNIDEEAIIALMPSLVLLSPYQYGAYEESVKRFEQLGIQVVVVQDAADFEDVYDVIRLIGTATGAQAEAEEIVESMQERLAAVQEKAQAVTEQKRVWIEVSPAPDIFTTGKNTFMDEMLQAIQAINTAGEQEGWVSFTEEEIVQLNPDVIITTYGNFYPNPEEAVLQRSGWGEVPAVKSGQVYDVDNDTVTRTGPRLMDGVEELAALIYPEIFN